MKQCRGEGDLLLLTAGVAGEGPIGLLAQLEKSQQSIDVFHESIHVDVVEFADAEEELASGPLGRQPRLVRQVDDLPANGELFLHGAAPLPSVDGDDAVLRLQEAIRN